MAEFKDKGVLQYFINVSLIGSERIGYTSTGVTTTDPNKQAYISSQKPDYKNSEGNDLKTTYENIKGSLEPGVGSFIINGDDRARIDRLERGQPQTKNELLVSGSGDAIKLYWLKSQVGEQPKRRVAEASKKIIKALGENKVTNDINEEISNHFNFLFREAVRNNAIKFSKARAISLYAINYSTGDLEEYVKKNWPVTGKRTSVLDFRDNTNIFLEPDEETSAGWSDLTEEQIQATINKAKSNNPNTFNSILYNLLHACLNQKKLVLFPELLAAGSAKTDAKTQVEALIRERNTYGPIWIAAGGETDIFTPFEGDATEQERIESQVTTPDAEDETAVDEDRIDFKERADYVQQCFLLSHLETVAEQYKTHYLTGMTRIGDALRPYGAGVVPITNKIPELILNHFSFPIFVQDYFKSKRVDYEQTFKLFGVDRFQGVYTETLTDPTSNQAINNLAASIEIKGATPSTARADSKVNVSFDLPSLSRLSVGGILKNFERPGFVSSSVGFQRYRKDQII